MRNGKQQRQDQAKEKTMRTQIARSSKRPETEAIHENKNKVNNSL
jgi:hypothetical protein